MAPIILAMTAGFVSGLRLPQCGGGATSLSAAPLTPPARAAVYSHRRRALSGSVLSALAASGGSSEDNLASAPGPNATLSGGGDAAALAAAAPHGVLGSARASIAQYMVGVKKLWAALSLDRALRKQRKEGLPLDRAGTEVVTRTRRDFLKVLPLVLNPLPPPLGLIPVLLAMLRPRTWLSSHFWTLDQADEYAALDALERKRPLSKVRARAYALQGAAPRRPSDDGYAAACRAGREALDPVVREWRAHRYGGDLADRSGELAGAVGAFRDGGALALQALPRKHVVHLARAFRVFRVHPLLKALPTSLLRRAVAKRAAEVRADDALLEAEGLASFSRRELRDACNARGLPVGDDCQRTLGAWLLLLNAARAAVGGDDVPDSLVLHLPALVASWPV